MIRHFFTDATGLGKVTYHLFTGGGCALVWLDVKGTGAEVLILESEVWDTGNDYKAAPANHREVLINRQL